MSVCVCVCVCVRMCYLVGSKMQSVVRCVGVFWQGAASVVKLLQHKIRKETGVEWGHAQQLQEIVIWGWGTLGWERKRTGKIR